MHACVTCPHPNACVHCSVSWTTYRLDIPQSTHPPQPPHLQSWAIFTLLLVTVLGGLFVAWINPSTGFGDEYTQAVQSLAPGQSPEVTIGLLLTIFGIAHSGLASLRPKMEDIIGARVRVRF